MNIITVAFSFFFFLYILAQEDPKCYHPDGGDARRSYYTTCESKETSFKTCCPRAWTCLKNGLCQSGTGKAKPVASITRGACTNQDWSACPSICPFGKSNTTVFVAKCDDGKYCCHARESYDCCSGGDWRFSIKEPGKPVAAIAGGTVGGVVGVAVLAGIGWWLWKRKRAGKGKAEKTAVDETSSTGSQVPHPSVAEASAGPDNVLVESDARTTQAKKFHELPA